MTIVYNYYDIQYKTKNIISMTHVAITTENTAQYALNKVFLFDRFNKLLLSLKCTPILKVHENENIQYTIRLLCFDF